MKHPVDLLKGDSGLENEGRSLVPYRESPSFQVPAIGDSDFEDEQSSGLHDYWLMVRHRIWLIVAIAFLVTALAVIYVARQADIYEAEARIQVDLENNPAVGASRSGSVIITNRDDPSYFNTQLLLLRSPAFLRRVAKTLTMEEGRNAFSWEPSRRETTWSTALRMAGLGGNQSGSESVAGKPLRANSIAPMSADGEMADADRLEPYVGAIRGGLDVKSAEISRLISIDFRHYDPHTAATVANVVADTFVQANWERRATSTSTASEFLQKRIAELQLKIGENDRRLIEYAKNHQIFPLDSGRDIESDRLAALDRGLLEAENQRKAADSEYQAALAPGAAAALIEGSSTNGQLSILSARLADLRQRREVMLLEAGENWPEVKELNKQIGNLEDQIKDTREHAIGVLLTNLETRYKQALSREQALRKSFEQTHSAAMNQNEAAIDYRMIQQETTTYRGLLDSLLQRSKENDVVLAATPNNVHVTDYATLPVVPVGPRRLTIVGLAFALSLSLAVGLVILLGSLEDSTPVDSVERVERMFGLPALAVIPIGTRRRRQLRSMLKLKNRNGHKRLGLLLHEEFGSSRAESENRSQKAERNGNGHTGLLLYEEKRSRLAESYKKLRTSVLLPAGNRALNSLLVTSSLPGEGKTTAVINTGLVISQTGSKVLLIDGDLRHPTLHEILGFENELGLSTILASDSSEAGILSMIEQYEGGNLYVLPSGPATDNPAELLGSERMKQLIHTLKNTFSHIIIDSPPISYFTDAVLISSVVDGVLMIVRGPKSPRQVARYSIQSLDGVGAPILGVVLNAVNVRSNDYSYYRKYYR
ncbi:MAG: GumC family protein [Pyrinomonadaceae bacterium]